MLKKSIEVIVDQGLLSHPKVAFHPNINTATLIIETEDFQKFLEWSENKISFLNL